MPNTSDFDKEIMLDICCSCNKRGYVFLNNLTEDYYTVCRKCGKRIYGLNCPKCNSGFTIPEDNMPINKIAQTWQCESCHQQIKISAAQSNAARFYIPEEIPKNLIKEKAAGKSIWALPLKGKVFLAVVFILILIIKFFL